MDSFGNSRLKIENEFKKLTIFKIDPIKKSKIQKNIPKNPPKNRYKTIIPKIIYIDIVKIGITKKFAKKLSKLKNPQ